MPLATSPGIQALPSLPAVNSVSDVNAALSTLVGAINDRLARISALTNQTSGGATVLTGAAALPPAGSGYAAGTLYLSTTTGQWWRWSGSLWVSVSGGGSVQIAYCAANIGLGTSSTPLNTASITLAQTGNYLFTGVFEFLVASGDTGQLFTGQLTIGGHLQSRVATYVTGISNTQACVAQQWTAAATAGEIAALSAFKGGGTGSSQGGPNCCISALLIA